MTPVAIGLGSNLGARERNIADAIGLLAQWLETLTKSSLYATEPMYLEAQPQFLNMVITGLTNLSPLNLLARLKQVEREVGRVPTERYGPREIDVDLLTYGSLEYRFINGSKLVLHVPHPKIAERRFVLAPLAEIAPSWPLPGLPPLAEMLLATDAQAHSVQRLDHARL